MSRSVPEWIGKTDNSKPSTGCMRRICERQGWRCAISGVNIRDGVKVEFDHIIPLWLGGENREANLQAVTAAAHAGKTKAEAKVRAKVNRIQLKRIGAKKKQSSWGNLSRRMDGTVYDKKTGEIVR